MIVLYVIMGLVLVTMIAVFSFVYFKYIKVDPTQNTAYINHKSNIDEVDDYKTQYYDDAKSFLEFVDIMENAIDLGNYQYRAIIECSSISYGLRTPLERDQIEYGFQGFLNSLSYPIVLYVQTRAVDNTNILKGIQQNADKAVENLPSLKQYSDTYMAYMNELPYITGFPKCKKKYVIIPYDEITDLSELSDEEKEDFCMDELMTRAASCCAELNAIGIKTTILDRRELAKVIYAAFHRNDIAIVENVIAGYLNTLVVKGEVMDETFSDNGKLVAILNSCKNQIYTRLELKAETPEQFALYKRIYECFDILCRESVYDWQNMDELLSLMRQRADELESERMVV